MVKLKGLFINSVYINWHTHILKTDHILFYFLLCLADEILATLLPIFQSIRESAGLLTSGQVSNGYGLLTSGLEKTPRKGSLCSIGPKSRVSVISLPNYNSLPRVHMCADLVFCVLKFQFRALFTWCFCLSFSFYLDPEFY